MERTARVRLMVITIRLFWLIPQHGIVNPVQMINANSASWWIKIHVTLAKGQVDQE